MQKKIIALAIAAAISAPAFADNANVTVYGKAILDIENVQNDKSPLSGATRVQTNASRLGFKGTEDVGDGMKASFQYEVEFDADGSGNTVTAKNATSGTVDSSTATYTATPSGFGKTRNSGIALEGSFGKVNLGIWDTPFKVAHNKIELFDNTTVFSSLNLIGRANGNSGANFGTRQKNDLQYWSPKFADVQVTVSYSPDEGNNGAATKQGYNKSFLSAAATYDNHDNGIYVSAAYESRADANVIGANDVGTRLVARYTLGDFWIGANIESILVNNTAAGTTAPSYTQNNAELVGSYKLGASTIAASYAQAGAAANTKGSDGATQTTVRYGYNFSKRTEGFVAYTQLKNDTNATYGFGSGTTWGTDAGSTQTAIGAGLVHSF